MAASPCSLRSTRSSPKTRRHYAPPAVSVNGKNCLFCNECLLCPGLIAAQIGEMRHYTSFYAGNGRADKRLRRAAGSINGRVGARPRGERTMARQARAGSRGGGGETFTPRQRATSCSFAQRFNATIHAWSTRHHHNLSCAACFLGSHSGGNVLGGHGRKRFGRPSLDRHAHAPSLSKTQQQRRASRQ